jgi:hypothetical protein
MTLLNVFDDLQLLFIKLFICLGQRSPDNDAHSYSKEFVKLVLGYDGIATCSSVLFKFKEVPSCSEELSTEWMLLGVRTTETFSPVQKNFVQCGYCWV